MSKVRAIMGNSETGQRSNADRFLTRSLDLGEEGLAMKATRTCSIDGCNHVPNNHGWCYRHHHNWARFGDPLLTRYRGGIIAREGLDLEEVFYLGIAKRPSGCWEWQGTVSTAGYGRFGGPRQMEYAHRWSYRHFHGPIPEGLEVRHACDNRLCVNPEHLSVGTRQDNMDDAVARERVCRGAARSRKLTESDVREIRRRRRTGEKQQDLADRYGVGLMTVNNIIHRRTWAWLADEEVA